MRNLAALAPLFLALVPMTQAATIYSLATQLTPVSGAESASASVVLNQDTTSTLTLVLSYQFQSRLALQGLLFSGSVGSSPVVSAFGLPQLSSLGFLSSVSIDAAHFSDPNGVVTSLVSQPVIVELVTTSGTLSGSGFFSARQGGGPPVPPGVPEPSSAALFVIAFITFLIYCLISRRHLGWRRLIRVR